MTTWYLFALASPLLVVAVMAAQGAIETFFDRRASKEQAEEAIDKVLSTVSASASGYSYAPGVSIQKSAKAVGGFAVARHDPLSPESKIQEIIGRFNITHRP